MCWRETRQNPDQHGLNGSLNVRSKVRWAGVNSGATRCEFSMQGRIKGTTWRQTYKLRDYHYYYCKNKIIILWELICNVTRIQLYYGNIMYYYHYCHTTFCLISFDFLVIFQLFWLYFNYYSVNIFTLFWYFYRLKYLFW